jgi:ArsR family transcriptional regulator
VIGCFCSTTGQVSLKLSKEKTNSEIRIDILQNYNIISDMTNPIDIFKALSNEARLQILEWLKDPKQHFSPQEGIDLVRVGVCVSQITEKLNMNQSTASQYLSILQRAGLVHATRLGKWTYYRRNEEAIDQIGRFLQK